AASACANGQQLNQTHATETMMVTRERMGCLGMHLRTNVASIRDTQLHSIIRRGAATKFGCQVVTIAEIAYRGLRAAKCLVAEWRAVERKSRDDEPLARCALAAGLAAGVLWWADFFFAASAAAALAVFF